MNATDANGYKMMQAIISAGQQKDGGYCDYVFPKEGETEPSPKRSYSKLYEPFDWVIGTGNYIDNIDTAIEAANDNISDIRQTRVTGLIITIICCFVFMLVSLLLIIKDIHSTMKNTSRFNPSTSRRGSAGLETSSIWSLEESYSTIIMRAGYCQDSSQTAN